MYPRSTPLVAAPLIAAALFLGCGSPKDTTTPAACNTCHGSDTNAAPPKSTTGATATTDVAVGAHQVHLAGGSLGIKVACEACHVLPTTDDHANGTVEVTFGTLASTGGLSPKWDHSSATCSNGYCHSAGGATPSPVWTKVDGTQSTCGSCHGDPPTANGHPQVASLYCAGCHPGTMSSDGTVKVGSSKHLNGVVEVSAFAHPTSWMADHQELAKVDTAAACKTCHGSDLKGLTGSGGTCWLCHPTGPPVGP